MEVNILSNTNQINQQNKISLLKKILKLFSYILVLLKKCYRKISKHINVSIEKYNNRYFCTQQMYNEFTKNIKADNQNNQELLKSLKLKIYHYEEVREIYEGYMKENLSKEMMLAIGGIFTLIFTPIINNLKDIVSKLNPNLNTNLNFLYSLLLIGLLVTLIYIIFKGIETCSQNRYRKKIAECNKAIKLLNLIIDDINPSKNL